MRALVVWASYATATCLLAAAGCEATTARGAADGLPAPVAVCVRIDGSLVTGVATPGRAGVYDEREPLDPSTLDWMVPGIGCVAFSARDRSATCASAPAPFATPTPCGQ
ncbi:MAG: hypothetical protein HY908_25230 [Myxococcales bacterium]|nr:hypothetical protein [Myxococcales bacterium]